MTAPNAHKPGYKHTLVGWIPEEWEPKTFKTIAKIIMGQSPPGDTYNSSGNGVALLNGPTEFTERYPIRKQWTTKPTRLAQAGDVLLCVRGSSTGRINIADDQYCIGRGVAAIRQTKATSSDFLEYLINNTVQRILRLTSGSTFPNIDSKNLSNILIPLPPLPEQKKIAEILGTWDRAIEQTGALIEQKKLLKKGLMQQLLTGRMRFPQFGKPAKNGELPDGWKEVKSKTVSQITAGGTPSTKIAEYWDGDVPWMTSGDLHQKRVNDVGGRITTEGLNNSSAKMIPIHSVLVGLAGQGITRGTVAVNEIELSMNQSVAAFLPKPTEVHYLYLYYNLDSRYEELRRLSTGDGGRGGLNLALLGGLKIPLPSLEEQLAIAETVTIIDNEIQQLNNKLALLREQKRGLMQKLLTGEVRVKV